MWLQLGLIILVMAVWPFASKVLKEATAWKAPPTQRYSQKKGKIYYATQVHWRCCLGCRIGR